MRIHVDKLSFSIPPGFKDITGYCFKAPREKELLDVDASALPPEVSDLDGLLAERRGQLEDGLPGAIVIEGVSATVLAGLPARTLIFGLVDRDARYRGRWALAMDTAASYLQIAYQARADNVLEGPRFDQAVASASLGLDASPTPEGFVRRWAGKLWLDVPEHLEPPRTYIFVSPDETMRLEVAVVTTSAEPSIESEIAQDSARGDAVSELSRSELATPHLSSTLHTFTLTRSEGGLLLVDAVRRAHLHRRDVPVIHVFGRAPSIDADALSAAFDALVNSVEHEDGR